MITLEAWIRAWFEWKMRHLRALVVLALVGLGVALLAPVVIGEITVPAAERRDAAKAKQCFTDSQEDILGYIAKVPDADEAAYLATRYEDLAEGPGRDSSTRYCGDVYDLEMDAVFAAEGEYPEGSPAAIIRKQFENLFPSPSPSPSVSVSPTP